MWAALVHFRAELNDCLDEPSLCQTTIQFVVENRLGPFMSSLYEPCSENVMFSCRKNDRNVGIAMAAVHRQVLCHGNSADGLRTSTQSPSVTGPFESDPGRADPHSYYGSGSSHPVISINVSIFSFLFSKFSKIKRTFCNCIIFPPI